MQYNMHLYSPVDIYRHMYLLLCTGIRSEHVVCPCERNKCRGSVCGRDNRIATAPDCAKTIPVPRPRLAACFEANDEQASKPYSTGFQSCFVGLGNLAETRLVCNGRHRNPFLWSSESCRRTNFSTECIIVTRQHGRICRSARRSVATTRFLTKPWWG